MSDFDVVMEQIRAGLTGEAEHDIDYLLSQAQAHQDSPLAKEIARECGRMVWELLPGDQKDAFSQTIDDDGAELQAALDEADRLGRSGRCEEAARVLEPQVHKLDELIAGGWYADDTESVYFDFDTLSELFVWKAHTNEEREPHGVSQPIALVFFVYSSCLYECERYAEAVEWIEKAIRWNPASARLRFELAEDYKRLGDIDACDAAIDVAYPLVANASDMAKWHREKAFVEIERGELELAAAHLIGSLIFEGSDSAANELMYIKAKYGKDFTGMDGNTAVRILEENGRPLVPDMGTLHALADLLLMLREERRVDEAADIAEDLYGLTGDESVGRLAEMLRSESGR